MLYLELDLHGVSIYIYHRYIVKMVSSRKLWDEREESIDLNSYCCLSIYVYQWGKEA